MTLPFLMARAAIVILVTEKRPHAATKYGLAEPDPQGPSCPSRPGDVRDPRRRRNAQPTVP
ncbi:MAG: hypothetical protein HRT86_04210 [Ilumatobacteraceae bacterium]|nr:hypothetical protein [Ilumatobacteraceae bacterium]